VALVLGGARSGKSAFAQDLAQQWGEPVVFVATGLPIDEEMAARIEAHRRSRPGSWRTLEVSQGVGYALRGTLGGSRTVLLDCLSFLVSNCMEARDASASEERMGPPAAEKVVGEVVALLDAARDLQCHLIVVSNEVGMGVVPPYPLGRAYRDLLGLANQRVAAAADAVYLMVAGIAVDVKRLSAGPSTS
jgi:adenosylcobinamide kinase/adenosylcobinamide-phosphate guanylyltransferase